MLKYIILNTNTETERARVSLIRVLALHNNRREWGVKESPTGPDGAGAPARRVPLHSPEKPIVARNRIEQNLTMGKRLPIHRPATGKKRVHPRAADVRPTAHQRGYGATWRRLRILVLREEPLCRHCSAAATDVDHIVPLAVGGTHDRENLCPLCHACHSRKTVLDRLRGNVRRD